MNKLLSLINLKPEERQSFRQLFLLSLITGIGLSYYFVAVNTFLIQKTSVSNLPYAYIISGLGGVMLIRIYQSRQRKNGVLSSYRESVLAFFVVAIAVFFSFRQWGGDPGLAVYLAYAGFLFNMPFTIMFALGFSGVCARLYNMAQSKRLLALVGTGEIIASIIGYLTAPAIVALSGSPDYLLPVSAICILPAVIPIANLNSHNREKLSHVPVAASTLKKLNLSFFTNDRFYLLIALVSVFSVSAIYFVDYAYLVSVRFMSSYTGIQIATIVGFFFSLVKIGELIFSFLSGHILSSKGVRFSILLMPLLLCGCFFFAFGGSLISGDDPVFLLSFIFLAKFVERVIRKAISTPAIKVLYQVTGSERLRIEATIEGVLNQIATVFAGLLLLLLSSSFQGSTPILFLTIVSVVCLVLFLGWSATSQQLYEKYRKKIWEYLHSIKTNKPAAAEKIVSLEINAREESHSQVSTMLSKAVQLVNESHKKGSINTLLLYHPPALNHIESDNEQQIDRKVITSYYANDNYFYRLAVINYFKNRPEGISLKLLREFAEISDLKLRLELIRAFNRSGQQLAEEERFFFVSRCEFYSNELILAQSARFDLAGLEHPVLHEELQEYTNSLTEMLFELLKLLYDASAIQVIYEIITSDEHQDIESRLFALELLDNTVDEEMKKRLNPIFEPAPFDQKISTLQQFVPVTPLSQEKQLREILMKDFALASASLKEVALEACFTLTGDSQVLNAFHASNIPNLRVRASQLLHADESSALNQLVDALRKTYHLSRSQAAYLCNFGILLPGLRKEKSKSAGKSAGVHEFSVDMGSEYGGIVVDTLALALLIDKNQSGA